MSTVERRACRVAESERLYEIAFFLRVAYQNLEKQEIVIESRDPFFLQPKVARRADTLRSGSYDYTFGGDLFAVRPVNDFRVGPGQTHQGRATGSVLVARSASPDQNDFLVPGTYYLDASVPWDLHVRFVSGGPSQRLEASSGPVRIDVPRRVPVLRPEGDCLGWYGHITVG